MSDPACRVSQADTMQGEPEAKNMVQGHEASNAGGKAAYVYATYIYIPHMPQIP